MITAQMTAYRPEDMPYAGDIIPLVCWQCGSPLAELSSVPLAGSGSHVCSNCKAVTRYVDGIWCAISARRLDHYRSFIAEYESIRAAEGRGSSQSDYYLSLPYRDISGVNSDQWSIRAHTYQTIERRILTSRAKLHKRSLRVLDLGAGNGWMSYRLALQGHLPVAVDLLMNERDGLRAADHYRRYVQPLFPRVQAELDRLPFAPATFDIAIFNASFHYSVDYLKTFAEALRCTREDGGIVIADTPWYSTDDSGKQMVEEKQRRFLETYGFASNSIASLEYLTPNRLNQLQEAFKLEWRCIQPFYGLKWSLRPIRAKLNHRRPPSQFRIYMAWRAA